MSLRNTILTGLLLFALWAAGQPYCIVTHYDEEAGLSLRAVKQLAQDANGMIWAATWDGLNRFDGYRFQTVKPQVGDGTGIYSARVSDIRTTSTGNLWCRIDDRCYLFDVSTHRFLDFMSAAERQAGRPLRVKSIRPAVDGTTLFECEDGICLVADDKQPDRHFTLSAQYPTKKFRSVGNKQYRQLGTFTEQEILYSGTDRYGTIWLVTTDGSIYYTTAPEVPLTKTGQRLPADEKMLFSIVDQQGGLWLRSPQGAYRLTFGKYPHSLTETGEHSMARAFMKDRKGRVWIADKSGSIRLYDGELHLIGALTREESAAGTGTCRVVPAGSSSAVRGVAFGSSAYCLFEDSNGQVWIGCKPDGLYRLHETDVNTFRMDHFKHDASDSYSLSSDEVYDIAQDPRGRLWIATLQGGLNIVEQPAGKQLRFVNSHNDLNTFPEACQSLRRIVFNHQGIAMMASTQGLLLADATLPSLARLVFRRHVGEANRTNSLSNVAVMDVMEDSHHHVWVATESGGVNRIADDNLLAGKLSFCHYDRNSGLPSDVAIALFEDSGKLWVVSDHGLIGIAIDDEGAEAVLKRRFPLSVVSLDAAYWKQQLYFSEAHPLSIADGRWLFGLLDGAMSTNLETLGNTPFVPRLVLTGVAVQNQNENLAVSATDTLTLQPDGRSVIINFAALDYESGAKIRYAFRIGESGEEIPWSYLGENHSITLLDMMPGTYRLQIRSTNSCGEWVDNIRTLTIIVVPTFWETRLAKTLLLLLVLLVVYACYRVYSYVNAIKRKQRETLEAYLQLMNENARTPEESESNPPPPSVPAVELRDEEDEAFMKRVIDFVEQHISDSDVTIDDMAEAAAISKSGLNRKMKSMLGVTPAEFLKDSRIEKASRLLLSTRKSIQEIALVCGFADQHYFGKCFKARKGVTPSQYRQQNEENRKE